MKVDDKVRLLARTLRRIVPPLLPVRLYLCHGYIMIRDAKCVGSAHLTGKDGRWTHFVVRLRRDSLKAMRETLIHEWAHCLSWEDGELVDSDHGRLFKLAEKRIRVALRKRERRDAVARRRSA